MTKSIILYLFLVIVLICFSDNAIECHPLNLVKVQEVNSVVRMVTPAVLREAQNHFGCYSETKFGAPLDGRVRYFCVTESYSYTNGKKKLCILNSYITFLSLGI